MGTIPNLHPLLLMADMAIKGEEEVAVAAIKLLLHPEVLLEAVALGAKVEETKVAVAMEVVSLNFLNYILKWM